MEALTLAELNNQIRDLEKQIAEVRLAAQHADDRRSYRADMERAADLQVELRRLKKLAGWDSDKQKATKEVTKFERKDTGAVKANSVNHAMSIMEDFLSSPKKNK